MEDFPCRGCHVAVLNFAAHIVRGFVEFQVCEGGETRVRDPPPKGRVRNVNSDESRRGFGEDTSPAFTPTIHAESRRAKGNRFPRQGRFTRGERDANVQQSSVLPYDVSLHAGYARARCGRQNKTLVPLRGPFASRLFERKRRVNIADCRTILIGAPYRWCEMRLRGRER